MKFLAITLIVHRPDPLTGIQKATHDRFREVLDNALLAEELGFDGFGVGERHERPFISSSPTVVLSHVAALTKRIRLFTAVTTLSLLDPVRAYEDYATLDHLSGGRLDLIIGKGNGAAQRDLFHVTPEDQWDRNAESYEVFRKIWRQDKVTADTRFRPPLTEAEVWPRPYQRPVRIWHGSATSKESVDLAARHGDPLFSANVTNPVEPYAELIRHCAPSLQRVADDAEVRQHRGPRPFGHHQLAHLRAVGGVREGRSPATEQPVHETVHHIAGSHHDQRLGQETVRVHRVQGRQQTVRTHAHHRPAAQQLGRLEARRHVVAPEVVHQSQVEGALQQSTVDVRLLRADQLHLRDRVRGPELPHGRDDQRHGGRVHRAEPDHTADAVLVAGRAAQPVHRVQHTRDVRQQLPALITDLRPGPLALQQVHAELALEIANIPVTTS